MLFHVFRHVERNECIVVAEQEVGKGLCEFGFTNTSWAQEDERTAWTLRVFQTCTCTTDALTYCLDCIFLRNDALVQFGFHVQQLGGFFFRQLVHRNTGPDAEHFGNSFFVNFVKQIDAACLYVGFLC